MSDISGVSSLAFNTQDFDPNNEASVAITLSRFFDKIDTSNSGYITDQELSQAYSTVSPLPSPLSETSADAIFAQLDPNQTGRIPKDAFIEAMQQLAQQDASNDSDLTRKLAQHHGTHAHRAPPPDDDSQNQTSAWSMIGQILGKR